MITRAAYGPMFSYWNKCERPDTIESVREAITKGAKPRWTAGGPSAADWMIEVILDDKHHEFDEDGNPHLAYQSTWIISGDSIELYRDAALPWPKA